MFQAELYLLPLTLRYEHDIINVEDTGCTTIIGYYKDSI